MYRKYGESFICLFMQKDKKYHTIEEVYYFM